MSVKTRDTANSGPDITAGLYLRIIDHTPCSILLLTVDLVCLYANETFERSTGVPRSSLNGKHLSELRFGTQGALLIERAIRAALHTRREQETSVSLLARGIPRYFHTRVYPEPKETGTPDWVTVYLNDVTEQQKMENALRDRERSLTERRKTEEALKASENRYHSLVEASPDGIVCIDLKGRALFANTEAARMLGSDSPEELIGRESFNVIDAGDLERGRMFFSETLETGITRNAELTFVRKDGTRFPAELSSARLEDAGGVPSGAVVLLRDISSRKETESRLRENRLFLERILATSPDIIYVFDLNLKKLVYANIPIRDILGHLPENEQGASEYELISIFHPDDVQRLTAHLERLQTSKNDTVIELEFRVRHADGRWLWMFSRDTVFSRSGHGEVNQIIGTVINITGRKQAEERIRESEELSRAIIETSPDAIIVTVPGGTIALCNTQAARLHGFERPDEMVGKSIYSFFAPEDVERAQRESIRAARAGGVLRNLEYLGMTRDGRKVPIELSLSIMRDEHGRPVRGVGIARDITERNRYEAQLLAARYTAERHAREVEEGKRILDALMASVPEGIIIADAPAARVRMVSSYGQQATELTIDETRGLTIEEYAARMPARVSIPDEGMPLRRAISHGELITNEELVMRLPDGRSAVLLTNAGPIRDAQGAITGGVFTWRDITELKQAQDHVQENYERFRSVTYGIINALSKLVELKDPYTAGHQRRVAQLAFAISRELGLSEEQMEGVRVAGLLHDIGKLYVPAEILSKPSRITILEFNIIKIHPAAGYEILKRVNFPWPIADVTRQHQERLDGSGYPRSLKDGDIFPETRIVSVADVIEAMSFYRPYRSVIGIEKALEEIDRNKGLLYDPIPADACLKLFREKRFTFH